MKLWRANATMTIKLNFDRHNLFLKAASNDIMMKSSPFLLAVGLATISAKAQDAGQTAESRPRPRIEISETDILKRQTTVLGERHITFEKVRPLILPPIPEPVNAAENAGLTDEPDALRTEYFKKRQFVYVGATVYVPDNDPSKAKSLVRFWPQAGKREVLIWVNANMLWLGGFGQFEDADNTYVLLMMMSETNIQNMEHLAELAGREWSVPETPEFKQDDTAEFVVIEGNPTDRELAPFRSLLELYQRDKSRLKAAFNERKAEQEQRRLERLADPPELKNLKVRYWRLDAAGQRGIHPQPAIIR